MAQSFPRRQRKTGGFTLTELAIVLGIIGLILGAIWMAASRVYTNQKITKATTEWLTISQNIRNIYGTKGYVDQSGDITVAMMNLGVFPAEMIAGGQPVSPWNTPVEIYGAWPDANHFIVEFDGQDRGRTSISTIYCLPLLLANYATTATDVTSAVEYLSGTWAASNVANPTEVFGKCTTASFVYPVK